MDGLKEIKFWGFELSAKKEGLQKFKRDIISYLEEELEGLYENSK